MSSDTPRTDAERSVSDHVPGSFARQLERELNAANAKITSLTNDQGTINAERKESMEQRKYITQLLKERDEALEELKLIRDRLSELQSVKNDEVSLPALAEIAMLRLRWRTEERDEARLALENPQISRDGGMEPT